MPVRPASSSKEAKTSFPPILVNIGDLLSYWTCGLLKSTVHRVIFPLEEQKPGSEARDRYSMAYFCHPVNTTELVAVPSKLVEQRRKEPVAEGPRAGKIMTAGEHLASRLAATYGE